MIPVMVVPILARPDLLDQMLNTVDHPVDTLIVIDNGGVLPGDFAHREWADNGYLIRSPSNLGVATSWNLGIKMTPHVPWWLIVNFDVEWPAGSLARFDTEDAARVVRLNSSQQPWCAFSIGEDVVRTVGLFDEMFHPAYLEDTDYQRRCEAAGAPVLRADIPVTHHNSSTLSAGYRLDNEATYLSNINYHRSKLARNELSEGGWSLTRRRANSWD